MFIGVYVATCFFLINSVSLQMSTPNDVTGELNESQTDSLASSNSSTASLIDKELVSCSGDVIIEQYVLLDNGSVLIPESGKVYDYPSYYRNNSKVYLCSEGALEAQTSSERPYHFSEEFLSCVHILLEPNEFEMLPNKSIYVDIYARLYDHLNHFLRNNGAYVCVPEFGEMDGHKNVTKFERVKFTGPLVYVSYIGISVSIISLFLHLAVFCVVPSVRNLPGCCLASLSLSLLLAYLCFIGASISPTKKHCPGLGAAIYYFFLASFFWMNVVSFDVWRSFRAVIKELRVSSHRIPRRRFCAYSAYSWLLPAALAIFAVKADELDLVPYDYRPSFGYAFCWFGKRKALMVFFASPLFIIMLLNCIFFLDSAYVINRATIKTSHANEAILRKRFFTIMRLALIMGLTWIVGIIAGHADQEALWYIFVILNTLQGLFIFIVFSCSSKVKEFFYRKLGRTKRSRQGTSVRTISQVSATI